jgi:hypothetical protein
MSQDNRPAASPLDAIIPTNPLAALSCYTGIFSILCCFLGVVLGPTAIVLGVLGLKKWTLQESSYGATTSRIRIWIGIVTGSIGTITGLISIIVAIVSNMK